MRGRWHDYTDFAAVPAAMIGVGIMTTTCSPGFATAALVGGWIAWTLIEYWVHRALHMRCFPTLRRLHMAHHQRPKAPSGGTIFSSLAILALFVLAIAAPVAAPAILGLLDGYFVFIVLHFGEHHGWHFEKTPLRWLAAAHDAHHHAKPESMFGVSTTFWDRLFGTTGSRR